MKFDPVSVAERRIRKTQIQAHRKMASASSLESLSGCWRPGKSGIDLLKIVRPLTCRCNLGIYDRGLIFVGPDGLSLVEPGLILVDDVIEPDRMPQTSLPISGPTIDAVVRHRRPVLTSVTMYSDFFAAQYDHVVAYDEANLKRERVPFTAQVFPSVDNMKLAERRRGMVDAVRDRIAKGPRVYIQGASAYPDAIAVRILITPGALHVYVTLDGKTWIVAHGPGPQIDMVRHESAAYGHQYDFGARSWNAAVALGSRWRDRVSISVQQGGAYLVVGAIERRIFSAGSLTEVRPIDETVHNLY